MIKGLLVFVAMFLVDFFWTKYTRAVVEARAAQAAGWSAGITLLGALTIVTYTQNQTYLLYAVAGGWAGTYVTLKYRRKKK